MVSLLVLLIQISLCNKEKLPMIKEEEVYTPHDPIKEKEGDINENHLLFKGHESETENGGAILYNSKRFSLALDYCKFNLCKAVHGGAIYYNIPSKITTNFLVTNSQFIECESKRNGGAIFLQSAYVDIVSIKIESCTFENNKASNNGGAIYAFVIDQIELIKCTFLNNQITSSKYNGASIFCHLGDYQANSVPENALTINDCSFSFTPDANNGINVYIQARNKGGNAPNMVPNAVVYIGGCTFSTTDANAQGFKHLVFTPQDPGFDKIEFTKCNCIQQGSDTVSIPSKFSINNFDFECDASDQCTPDTEIPGQPDPVDPTDPVDPPNDETAPDFPGYNKKERIDTSETSYPDGLVLEKSAFVSLSSTTNGGAVNCIKTNITIDDCKFYGDKGTNGGALYALLQTSIILFVKVTNSEFTKCSASKNGGAIYIETSQLNLHSVDIENCKFSSNEGQIGGAIYGNIRDEFTLQSCEFDNNLGKTSGSSLYVLAGNQNGKDKNNTFILLDNVFKAHQSSSSNVHFINEKLNNGYTAHISIIIGGCTFSATDPSNSEYKNLFLEEAGTIFGYESVTFLKCNCVKQGSNSISVPSIFELNNINVECSSIDSCVPGSIEQPTPETPEKPELDTDGYYIGKRINDEGKEIDLKNYKFSIETENEDGGAILINSNRVSCKLFNCTFNSCKGKNGGAIYIYFAKITGLTFLASKCSFSNCVASGDGGAIYLKNERSRDYDLKISDCKFTSNNAKNGGALYLLVRDNFTMNDCQFNNNVAASVGSSLWCKVGWNLGTTDNFISFQSNTFAFSPTENSVNVHFENYNIDSTKNELNAILSLGTSVFVANGNANVQFKHLEISKVGSGFQEIRIPECICIDKDNNAVSLPDGLSDSSITYNCGSLSSCKPDSDGYKYHEQIKDYSTSAINLEGYKFTNFNSEENGGAINIRSNKVSCTIKKCKFDSCYGLLGGAIHIYYTGTESVYACLIENTLFINNEAKTNGGAIHCQITQSNLHSVTIRSCTFRSNKAKKNGGAVYALARDSFTMENCVFEDNIVDGQGCSFWLQLGSSTKYNKNAAIINGNSFTFTPKNKNSINVYIESVGLNEDVTPNANLTFGSNLFTATSEIAGYKHVSVVTTSEFEVLNFYKCNCIKEGSDTVELPYSYDPELYFNFNCQSLDTCSITKKPTPTPAPDSDGFTPSQRIELTQAPKLKLIKTKFNNIESETSGGAVSLTKTSCEFTDCRFTTCKTKISTKDNGGGAIYIYYSSKNEGPFSALFVNCIFTSCESANHGGAINIKNTQSGRHSVRIEGCTFNQNKATNNGGAINAFGRDLLTIQFCTFNNNIAAQGSSLWCQIGWNLGVAGNINILYSNTFIFQPSESNPINVYITSYSLDEGAAENANVLIGNCQFAASNINGENQKHLIIKEVGKFQSIVFSECNCIQGAENTVSIESSIQPTYQNPLKYNCNSPDQCQAEQPPASEGCSKYSIRQEIYGKGVEIKDTCFNNLQSSSSRDGGAINAINAKLEIENCTFSKCSSEERGGAIYASFTIFDCEFELESCKFEDCVSLKYGGAVFFSNIYASESSIEKCKFINNTASSKGGALYYAPCANSKLLNCTFINNTCTKQYSLGSSIYLLAKNQNEKNLRTLDETNVVIDGCIFKSQPAENDTQMYINLKKTGKVEIGSNAFSFNGATEIPQFAKYIDVSADEGAAVNVIGQTCIDKNDESREDLISGINQNINFECEMPKEDDELKEPSSPKKKNNTGLIVGCVIAAVVVVAVIVVVVVIVVKRKNKNKYVNDLADDELEAQSGITSTDAADSL